MGLFTGSNQPTPVTISTKTAATLEAELRGVLQGYNLGTVHPDIVMAFREVCQRYLSATSRAEEATAHRMDEYAAAAMPQAMHCVRAHMGAEPAYRDTEGWADRAAQLAWRMALSMWQYRRVDGQ